MLHRASRSPPSPGSSGARRASATRNSPFAAGVGRPRRLRARFSSTRLPVSSHRLSTPSRARRLGDAARTAASATVRFAPVPTTRPGLVLPPDDPARPSSNWRPFMWMCRIVSSPSRLQRRRAARSTAEAGATAPGRSSPEGSRSSDAPARPRRRRPRRPPGGGAGGARSAADRALELEAIAVQAGRQAGHAGVLLHGGEAAQRARAAAARRGPMRSERATSS